MTTVKIYMRDHTPEFLRAMKEQVELGLEGIGAEAEGYAKDDCPVNSGRLRNSITFATKEFKSNGNDREGEKASSAEMKKLATPEYGTVYIGTNVKYAPYVEYGDYAHKIGKNHFLRDAVADHGDHFKEIMEAALKA